MKNCFVYISYYTTTIATTATIITTNGQESSSLYRISMSKQILLLLHRPRF